MSKGVSPPASLTISDTTVANILNRHGIVPAPERGRTGTWKEFLDRHLDVMWAADFFTVEVLRLEVAGSCLHHDIKSMSNQTDEIAGLC